MRVTAKQYAQLRGVSPTHVRNAARQSLGRPKDKWWNMPGVESFEQVGTTWIFTIDPEWADKRKFLTQNP